MPKINEIINSPHCFSRYGKIPMLIVYHIADGYYEGTKAWFMNPASYTSGNYIVAKDGRICQAVDIRYSAFCNGTNDNPYSNEYAGLATVPLVKQLCGNANHYSVSIEFEGLYNETQGTLTPKQIESAIWLTKHIQSEVKRLYGYDIPFDRNHLVGHYQINPRTRQNCPGQKFPWDKLIQGLKGNTTVVKPNPTPTEKVSYYVRKSPTDIKGQIGAFISKESAISFAKKNKGYSVYDSYNRLVHQTVTIDVGSKVKIVGNTYATGQAIPGWVKNGIHLVSQISGNNALLGANGGINSWVKLIDLMLV